jgi:hypothetical protein
MLLTTLGHMHASDTASSHLAALTLLVLLPFLYPIKAAEVEAPFGKPRFQTPEAQYSGSSSQLLALVCWRVSLDSANRQTIDGSLSVEPVQQQQPEGGPEHEQWWCGPAAGGAGEAAAEEAAVQVEEERGAASERAEPHSAVDRERDVVRKKKNSAHARCSTKRHGLAGISA